MNNSNSTLKIAINGYGRIGRCVLRALFERAESYSNIELVAINELADNRTIAHLSRYDTTHGRFPGDIVQEDNALTVNGKQIQIYHEIEISQLPWQELNVDLVLECSGSFDDRATAEEHIEAGAKRVLFSQPAQRDVDITLVCGVNDHLLKADHCILSNSSCTTNACVPVIKALNDAFEIESGVITTIHSAMNDQPVIDAYHHTDLRKTRSAMNSIIPVETGLAKGIGRILPELEGCFEAQAMRVPTLNVSAIDLSIVVRSEVTASHIEDTLLQASSNRPDILGYSNEPLTSCDFNHDTRSGIIDASQTRVAGAHLIKVLVWFDNEWGYANRMLDVSQKISAL